MSQVRDFAYVFVVSDKSEGFGLIARLFVPMILVASLTLPYVVPGMEISVAHTVSALAYESAVSLYIAGRRRLLGMFRLIGFFLAVGFALNVASWLLGSEPTEPATMAFRTLHVAAIVVALTLLFQLLSVGEIRYLLLRAGLRRYSETLAVAMALLPTNFITFSEAYIVAKLKLGKRNMASLIKPLVIDSIINSRHVAEALYIHGLPPAPRPRLFRTKDPAILVPAILVSLVRVVLP